jgi:hypothetical protein
MQTASCSDTAYACDTTQGACAPNFCGPGTANESAAWGPCRIDSSADVGICYPYNGAGQAGLCTEYGAVALNQSCSFNRDANSPADLCAAGTDCIVMADGSSFCASMCSPSGSGVTLNCPANNTCFAVVGAVGYCLQDCDPTATPDTCPTPLRCFRDGHCE